jgi:16S rRNA (guanine966-N2)-methyltransferase
MPVGIRIRPTADRTKEGIFNVLGPYVTGMRVLDMYAGSGSLGIEALSRGACHSTFIEKEKSCHRTIQMNLTSLGISDLGRILRVPVERGLETLSNEKDSFDLVLLDPPYFDVDIRQALKQLVCSDIFNDPVRIVCEHHKSTSIEEMISEGTMEKAGTSFLTHQATKCYGDCCVSFLEARPKRDRS